MLSKLVNSKNGRSLVWALVGVLTLVVILSVVLVLLFMRGFGEDASFESGCVGEDCYFEEDSDREKKMAEYERQIEEITADEEKAAIRVEYGNYLLQQGDGDIAFEQFSLVDESDLDLDERLVLYAGLRDFYAAMGDMELSDYYNDKIGEIGEGAECDIGGEDENEN